MLYLLLIPYLGVSYMEVVMSIEQFRVRVSLQSGELEVEGSESFVSSFREDFSGLVGRIGNVQPSAAPQGGSAAPSGTDTLAQSFPETLNLLPNDASATDQILVAGKFASSQAADATFSTSEAGALLMEQAVKLSNPSQSMKNNLKAKRVFKVGSRWKISKIGEEHLRTLTPQQ